MRCAVVLAGARLLLAAGVSPARNRYINPDGTGDAPTIQAGVDSAAAEERAR